MSIDLLYFTFRRPPTFRLLSLSHPSVPFVPLPTVSTESLLLNLSFFLKNCFFGIVALERIIKDKINSFIISEYCILYK